MKTIALEEHFSLPDSPSVALGPYMAEVGKRLADLGEGRLSDMDAAGIDMQVLSLSAVDEAAPGTATAASDLARKANDALAEAVRRRPDRFAGFGTLALQYPEGAAAEFERCVTVLGLAGVMIDGTTDGLFLDDPRFEPVLATAERLGFPIYLHPAPPPGPVFKAYFSGLPEAVARSLSISGYGWHAEMGLHALRLIVAGVFDRFPGLQVIIGHMGEFIPYCLARSDLLLGRMAIRLKRGIADYFRSNFHITTSGYFTLPPFQCALSVVGPDRILFAVDYPYSPNSAGRSFLDSLTIGRDDLEKIAHANAERLLKLRS